MCLTQADKLDCQFMVEVLKKSENSGELQGPFAKSNTFISWPTYLLFQNKKVLLRHIAGEACLTILKLRCYIPGLSRRCPAM